MVKVVQNEERSVEIFADEEEVAMEIVMRDERVLLMVEQRGPQGRQGIAGPAGPPSQTISGEVTIPNYTWVITHNLQLTEDAFNPASLWFEDQDGNPMEPEDVTWLNMNQVIAQWPEAVAGKWKL